MGRPRTKLSSRGDSPPESEQRSMDKVTGYVPLTSSSAPRRSSFAGPTSSSRYDRAGPASEDMSSLSASLPQADRSVLTTRRRTSPPLTGFQPYPTPSRTFLPSTAALATEPSSSSSSATDRSGGLSRQTSSQRLSPPRQASRSSTASLSRMCNPLCIAGAPCRIKLTITLALQPPKEANQRHSSCRPYGHVQVWTAGEGRIRRTVAHLLVFRQ